MNKPYIIYNLQDAQEEIEIILQKIRDPNYSHEQLYRSFQHLIHHVNIAWNAREESEEKTLEPSDKDIVAWSQYPKDLTLI